MPIKLIIDIRPVITKIDTINPSLYCGLDIKKAVKIKFVMEISVTKDSPIYLDICFPQALTLKYVIVKLNIHIKKTKQKFSLKCLQHSF